MKLIRLTNTSFAKVDDADYEALLNYHWGQRKSGNISYSYTRFDNGKGGTFAIDMHRAIMGITDPKILIDHKDGDGLNNQRSNLRPCNRSQNASNRHHPKNKKCTSSFFGVSWMAGFSKWRAYIVKDTKQKSLGLYRSEVDAAIAYNKAAIELHGEFAKQNIII